MRPVLAALAEQLLDVVRIRPREGEQQHFVEGLHRWNGEALLPALVVEVVGGEEVVRGIHRLEDLRRLLLAPAVLIGVPLQAHFAEARLELVEVRALLARHAEEAVRLVDRHHAVGAR